MKTSKIFREKLENEGLLLRPCAYDCISAMVLDKAGFEVIGTSGYAISASYIGKPDVGLLGFEGMQDAVRRIIESVPKRAICVDADTGYGDAVNVYYTVQKFIQARAAGLRIEDQGQRKMCGHLSGGSIITQKEMIGKICAAIRARDESNDPDFVIGARTDAIRVVGFEKTLERVTAYTKAGADYIYVEAPKNLEEIARLVEVPDSRIAFNYIYGGKPMPYSMKELQDVGVKYLSVPMVGLYSATSAMMTAADFLKKGDMASCDNVQMRWGDFNTFIGMNEWRQLEKEL